MTTSPRSYYDKMFFWVQDHACCFWLNLGMLYFFVFEVFSAGAEHLAVLAYVPEAGDGFAGAEHT